MAEDIAFAPMMPGYKPIPASSAAPGPVVPPTPPTPPENFIAMSSPSDDATIWSTTGKRRPEPEFDQAIVAYEAKQPLPEGFVATKSGELPDYIRKGFEFLNQPVQAGARGLDALTQPGLQWLANTMRGAVGKRDLQPSEFGTGPFEQTAERFSTPGGALLNLGLAVAGAIAPSATVAKEGASAAVKAGKAIPTALSMRNLAAGAGITGVLGTGGYVVGQLAAGEKPTWGDTAIQATGAVIAGGAKGLINHLVSKLPRDAGKKLAGEILDELTRKNPGLKTDPDITDIAINNADTLSRVVARGTQALRGEAATVAQQAGDEVRTILPRSLTSGQSKHLNTLMRDFGDQGNALIDAVASGDQATIKAAAQALQTARDAIVTHVGNAFSGLSKTAVQNAKNRVTQVLVQQQQNLGQFVEGAIVLKAMKDAGVEGGFNPYRVAQKIAGSYANPRGTQLNRVGDILAGGQPGQTLTSLPTFTQTSGGRSGGIMGALTANPIRHPLLAIGALLSKSVPGRTTVQSYLPAQGIPALPSGVPAGVQQAIQQRTAATLRDTGYGGVVQGIGDTVEDTIKGYLGRK